MSRLVYRDMQAWFEDKNGLQLQVTQWDGVVQLDIPGHETIIIQELGENVSSRKGNEGQMSASFSVNVDRWSDDSQAAMLDLINEGETGFINANWVSTVDNSDEFRVHLFLQVQSTRIGRTANAKIKVPHVKVTGSYASGSSDKVSIKCDSLNGNIEVITAEP